MTGNRAKIESQATGPMHRFAMTVDQLVGDNHPRHLIPANPHPKWSI